MLIVAVAFLATLGAEAVLSPFGNSEIAAERENVQSIDSIVHNVELYPKEESRAAIVHKKSSYQAHNWTCPINKLGDHPSPWYRYLNSLYCQFSKYEIQVAKKSFNVADIEDWGRIHIPNLEQRPIYDIEAWKNNTGQGIKIDGRNFKIFLSKTEIYNIAEQDSIRNMKISREQFNELNHVLDLTIKDQIHISCREPYLFIQGNNVIFSHINLSISALSFGDKCQELLKTGGLKYMNIFALNTVFIDDDIRKRTNLTVIAPIVEIIGERRIDLNGTDGKGKETGPVTNRLSLPGIDGKPGKPGEPGESGGNFFGIIEEFIHGENLLISASGGRGGRGQDGGNGTNGKDGTSPTVPFFFQCINGLCDSARHSSLLYQPEIEYLEYISSKARYRAMIVAPKVCYFRLTGEDSSSGGNGGDGGKGGEGGYPGDILLFELNSRSGVRKINVTGSKGFDGKGGVGGAGGKNGNITIVECNEEKNKWSMINTSLSNERAPSGKNGNDGENIRNRPERRAATCISKLEKAKIINQYKSFLRENMNDPFINFNLENFLNRLQNNQEVKSVYDFFGFVDELESLEGQFHNLNKDVNFLPFYRSLLNRISEYSKENNTDKKVLAYLYTATLGRKHNLEDDLESNLITDITSYLENVEEEINKLKDLEIGKAKEAIVQNYTRNYKSQIDKKINDANDLISKEIIPQIDNIETNIDRQIEKWVNEVVKIKNETQTDVEKLSKTRAQLEHALELQRLFGVLKIIGQVVSFMGPIGAVAGSAIGITSSLAETYMLDVPSDFDSATENFEQSVEDIESFKEQINNFTEEKASGLNKTLEAVSKEIKDKDEFKDLNDKVSAISSNLNEIGQKDKITVQDVRDLENKLETTLEKEKNDKIKEATKSPDDKNKQKAVAVIDNLQKIVELSSAVVDALNKNEERQKKLDEIDEAIKKKKKKFTMLKEYETSIYNKFVPMIEHIENDLDDVISQSNTKPKVVLDVNKWKVQSTLKDLMLKMQQATQNFTVQEGLVRYIEKLKEAMEMLLNMQGYIQDYQKDQTFANFIAGISSVTVNGFDDSYLGKEYRDALRNLKIIITTSIVIQRHKVAIDAFKQFVFPFANLYFKKSLLPSHLQLNNKKNSTLEDIILAAVIQIDQIKSTLKEYNIHVNGYDRCIFVGEFNVTSREPFFVWKNNQHNNMILRLLSGKEVIVKADISRSPWSYDAIKFNFVEFYFRSSNDTVQTGINEILEEFFINATHLGNSYYRYGGKTYLMTTPDLSFVYSFEKNKYGDPSHQSNLVSKIKNGDFILSPYASWKIQLSKRYNTTSFKALKIYKHAVDFVLGGTGRYIRKGDSNCEDLTVDQYYKAINNDNTEYRMDEFDEGDFVPLLEDDILTGGRREIIRESVTANEERRVARNNQVRSKRGKRRAIFCN